MDFNECNLIICLLTGRSKRFRVDIIIIEVTHKEEREHLVLVLLTVFDNPIWN